MGGTIFGADRLCIRVRDPSQVADLLDLLRCLDYDAERVGAAEIEATGPPEWPAGLAEAALRCFLVAWGKAHPEAEARIEPGLVEPGIRRVSA